MSQSTTSVSSKRDESKAANGRTKVGMSLNEERLLELIPMKPKKITSKELVDMFYGPNPPFNAQKIIVGRVNGIAMKLAYNNASYRVSKGERSGPHPMTYWREKVST